MNEIKLPKDETLWVSYRKTDGTAVAILTSKPARDCYYLYEVMADSTLKRLGKAKTPTELEEKFNIKARMNDKEE